MQENLYSKLIKFLKANNVPVNGIEFKPVKELIMVNKYGGLIKLKERVGKISLEDKVKKYSGIRWIGQPSYAIQSTSEKDFLDWEVNLNAALNDTKVSLLCIYDAYDYIHEGKLINEYVINKSLDTHSYVLKNLSLEEIS
ncbi:MEDS domain-containing protein [Clostridium sp. JNZ J1-5]